MNVLLFTGLYRSMTGAQFSTPYIPDRAWKGEGLCVFVNNTWCLNAAKIDGQSSPNVFFYCQPFFLPKEFTSVFIFAVPDANPRNTL